MKAVIISILVIVLVAGALYVRNMQKDAYPGGDEPLNGISDAMSGYFEKQMIARGVDAIGGQPIEGFDAHLLMIAFPGLVVNDFDGVETFEGRYSVVDGALEFMREQESPISSAELTISSEGYKQLLLHVSRRLKADISSDSAIDALIDLIDVQAFVSMRLGETAGDLDVTITPLEVLEDSRCPTDAVCIQAGTIRLRARLVSGLGEANQIFVLGMPITTEAEEITLVSAEPEPFAGVLIEDSEYLFRFEITKRKSF
ncbi:MAG: hypothetical protein COU47_03295 [Candidatus Niyogibacteria bacterium CG10_big_fil_rev_8_21_14_0_10_46_36]|uniref:Uncharacterized protein n=1 Tax=Candidatus Niyogibacteria bacterium CG10_big_fil_rev_8_21_14_0_10_46_36 TaxID=1974726 RepID=A0A2H0TCT1_9BACT|nr:MAG: hypothetical protein COU47_03295 [Candidatus Niyogibacteria bacterium CG10_big_fil_rev_8_21_14_0_10_46_36]